MNLSYWEYKTWLSNIDYTIVGSGIVGLNCALRLRSKFPKAKILVLEKGILPQGASTKNAGFACFGSMSEIRSDLERHSEKEMVSLVQKRWDGIQLLRQTLGDRAIDFQNWGGHELFLEDDVESYESCLQQLDYINALLEPVFRQKAFVVKHNSYGFNHIQENYITNDLEAQLDTGQLMTALLAKVQQSGIFVLNAVSVEDFTDTGDGVEVKTDSFDFKTKKLLIATNGFADQLLHVSVKPARAQVLITEPISNLTIKGTFHFDEGYYYFRNINDRILLGGGRNLDFKGEETHRFGQSDIIQDALQELLKKIILPNTPFKIERRWSGIMGVGHQKTPIVNQVSNNVFCGVRLGGMGIAIGTSVGNDLAELLE